MVRYSWNFAIIPTLPASKVPSLRGQSSQVLAQCLIVHNTPYFDEHLATFAFSYVPRTTVPLFIIVSTTSFISSLIASIREDSMTCVKRSASKLIQVSKDYIPLRPELILKKFCNQLVHWNGIISTYNTFSYKTVFHLEAH